MRLPTRLIRVLALGFLLFTLGMAIVGPLSSQANALSPPIFFANTGIDQPMNYINYPSAVSFNGNTYSAWEGGTGFLPYVSRLNETTQLWTTSLVNATNPISGDGHGAPSIAITPNGKIHVFFGSHISTLQYRRGDVATFGTWETMASPTTDPLTYPKPVVKGSDIYLFYRKDAECAGSTTWLARKSTDSGATWSSTHTILTTGFAAYMGGVNVAPGDSFTTFVFQFTKVNCGDQTRLNSYAAYTIWEDQSVKCRTIGGSDASSFGISEAFADANCKVETTTYGNFGDAKALSAVSFSVNPIYVIYLKGAGWTGGAWQYRFAKWDNTSGWILSTIQFANNFQDYGDIRVNSATDIEAFVMRNDTVGGSGLTTDEGGTMEYWKYNGSTWALTSTILTVAASGDALSAPMVPLNSQNISKVVFNQRRVSLTDANSKMYLWGDKGFMGDQTLVACFSTSNGGSLVMYLLPVLMGVGLIGGIVGAMKLTGKHESTFDTQTIVLTVVSIMVIVLTIAAVYPAITSLGNGAGC